MVRHRQADDEWQYGPRSSREVRETLLRLVLDFVVASRAVRGVERIALVGSLATDKPRPKDADVMVFVSDIVDLPRLAKLARRLHGRSHAINSTADVFLVEAGSYIGRICHHRECHPRVSCRARSCGSKPHLNDDLDVVTILSEMIAVPPIVLHPVVATVGKIPADVEELLAEPLRSNVLLPLTQAQADAPTP